MQKFGPFLKDKVVKNLKLSKNVNAKVLLIQSYYSISDTEEWSWKSEFSHGFKKIIISSKPRHFVGKNHPNFV